jgi:hypothetical protein
MASSTLLGFDENEEDKGFDSMKNLKMKEETENPSLLSPK